MPNSTFRQQQLNKRLSLNLLIQGAAAHTYLTAHHLVKDELLDLDPEFVRMYDKLAYSLHLCHWISDIILIIGTPGKFWRQISQPDHPFSRHAFLVRHGARLSRESRQHATIRAKRKGVATVPGIHYVQAFRFLHQVQKMEKEKLPQLEQLAIAATSAIWGIDKSRLRGKITRNVEFGNLHTPTTSAGEMLRLAAAGYGGVQRVHGQFQVVARAWVWPLLTHELTKGTAELICLHGLNQLDDETYQEVTSEADRIEHEVWMIQVGGALWRLFLAAVPQPDRLAESLMHVARMEPEPLEQLLMDLVEHPLTARATIADFLEP